MCVVDHVSGLVHVLSGVLLRRVAAGGVRGKSAGVGVVVLGARGVGLGMLRVRRVHRGGSCAGGLALLITRRQGVHELIRAHRYPLNTLQVH